MQMIIGDALRSSLDLAFFIISKLKKISTFFNSFVNERKQCIFLLNLQFHMNNLPSCYAYFSYFYTIKDNFFALNSVYYYTDCY